MIAICGRDRKELVERALPSVRAALPSELLVFALDPATEEYDVNWLIERGADLVQWHFPELPEEPPQLRVARIRTAQIALAEQRGESRVIFLDSDVLVGKEFAGELERLWALQQSGWKNCGAVTLGNYKGYSIPGYQLEAHPLLRVTIRTHALGGCIVFPFSPSLLKEAQKLKLGQSWDSALSVRVAGSRILTSDRSHVRHLGLQSGMCASRGFKGLDWQNQTADLQEIE